MPSFDEVSKVLAIHRDFTDADATKFLEENKDIPAVFYIAPDAPQNCIDVMLRAELLNSNKDLNFVAIMPGLHNKVHNPIEGRDSEGNNGICVIAVNGEVKNKRICIGDNRTDEMLLQPYLEKVLEKINALNRLFKIEPTSFAAFMGFNVIQLEKINKQKEEQQQQKQAALAKQQKDKQDQEGLSREQEESKLERKAPNSAPTNAFTNYSTSTYPSQSPSLSLFSTYSDDGVSSIDPESFIELPDEKKKEDEDFCSIDTEVLVIPEGTPPFVALDMKSKHLKYLKELDLANNDPQRVRQIKINFDREMQKLFPPADDSVFKSLCAGSMFQSANRQQPISQPPKPQLPKPQSNYFFVTPTWENWDNIKTTNQPQANPFTFGI